jgi:hypothetical protein
MGRIARSWHLMKQSYRVLMMDKELLWLPLLSGLCILVVLGGFFFGLGLQKEGAVEGTSETTFGVAGFLFYVVAYTLGFYFQAALIAGASQRMAGGDPTLGSALGAATKRLPTLIFWGVIAATVGMILRAIQDRSEALGKIVAGLAGAAWSLATFFVVPVLVLEGKPVGASLKRSAGLFKKTWGETVSGSLGLGLLSFLFMLPVIAVAVLLARLNPLLGVVVGLIGMAVVGVFFQALNGVYLASLYRYASEGETPAGFSQDELASAFR